VIGLFDILKKEMLQLICKKALTEKILFIDIIKLEAFQVDYLSQRKLKKDKKNDSAYIIKND